MSRVTTPARGLPILLAFVLSATAPLSASEPAGGARELSDADWRADLDQVVDRIESEHSQPFHRVSKTQLEGTAEALREDIRGLSDVEVMLRLAELVALVGDGHTRLALARLDPALAMPLEANHGSTPPPRRRRPEPGGDRAVGSRTRPQLIGPGTGGASAAASPPTPRPPPSCDVHWGQRLALYGIVVRQ